MSKKKSFHDDNLLRQVGRRMQFLRECLEPRPSQAAFAARLGISPRTYQNWEHGRHDPSLSALLVVAEALGVELVDLLEPAPVGWKLEHRRTGRRRVKR